MTVERGVGVIYHWFDIREDELEDIESWTDAARKIREVTDDVLRLAIAAAPVGRERGQVQRIKTSHYKAATTFAGRFRYRQAVGNRAPHAPWVHEGTRGRGRFPVVNQGKWQGPVQLGAGVGQLRRITPGSDDGDVRSGRTSKYVVKGDIVLFHHYLWKGQKANRWLERAGRQAYGLGNNH